LGCHGFYSTEDAIEACIERIGLATAALYYGARRLVCQQDPELAGRRIAHLPQAPSPKNSDCQKQEKRVDHNKKHEKTEGADSKMKKGSKIEEEPQCFLYEEYEDEVGRTLVRKRDFVGESADAKPSLSFKFIYGLKRKMWNERDYFKFYSESSLTAVFRKFLPDKFNFMGRKNVKLYASEFFHLRHELKQVLDSFSGEPSINIDQFRAHLKYFLQFLDTSCQEVSDRYEAMKKEGRVSWDMLWAFFPSDTKVVYRCAITREEICGIAESTKYSFCEPDGVPGFIVGLKGWDYNCQTWKPYSNLRRKIPHYSGPCDFTSLGTYPLQFKPNPHGEEKKFLAKGVWFGELSMQTRNRFMHYKGLMYSKSGVKEAVNGRVMIGLASFAKMNPNYPLGTAAPPSDTLRTNQVELIDISTREDRMFAPTIVYGFSFQIKKWGAFNIDGFEEIVFNEAAYEALVMDPHKKDTIYSLVHEYKRSDETRERVDPIVGKGEGCILLCYGPPGTGKTFTAESISEKLHAPLWSLSVSELGTTPETLETRLVRILDVAASWGAILLLDEADVYLERRNSGTMDLERNAMTGIFLRNLEYYKGLLFLTTNRVVAFDDAFCSRISMFLYYEKHSEHDRRAIWKTLLENLEVPDLGEFLDTDYASFELNAREIRNVVQVARTLAKTKGEEVNCGYLRHSLEMLASSLLELKRITGEPQTSSFKGITPPP